MKCLVFTGILLLASISAKAEVTERAGTITVGSDDIIHSISISAIYSENSDSANLEIEGEKLNSATKESSKISAYVKSPTKYFYYTLDLNPVRQSFGSEQYIVLGKSGTTTRGCPQTADALLTGFKGDGTKHNFCVELK